MNKQIKIDSFFYENIYILLVVIRQTCYYGESTIKLLCKNGSYYLMRKCHLRQRYTRIGSIVYFVRKAISSANDERYIARSCLPSLKPFGELPRGEAIAFIVENSYKLTVVDKAKNRPAFLRFLHFDRIFFLGTGDYFYRYIDVI